VQAKAEMRDAGVPLLPGTEGTATIAQALAAAEELGYPVLLKAAAGGGGRGMRLVAAPEELEDAYARASSEAEAAFSDGTLYVEKGVAPAPGRIERFRPPLGPGVRVDTFVEDGTTIPPHYDSLIAKVIVRDDSREAAIARARRALLELDVVGVPTTREAGLDILGSDEFRSGEYSTSFLEEAGARLPALAGA